MNVAKVVNRLKKLYPQGNIVLNTPENTTEIVCELDPVHQKTAVAIIDESKPHYHLKNTETYEIVKGQLILFMDKKKVVLKKGERIKILPKTIHSAIGQETWIKVYSNPGWSSSDHIMVKNTKQIS